ncbi:Os02g0789500 [Oryza sativa Japonica Group]|uniref:Os02g0789500 protein n=1 Tax=Oryza sativa subsp. japonica TaxID=39947 RepID=A0A0N7KG84_ORYSJ|nr:Os02g0789500 [Oryza sativa Japonica Group]
MSPSFHAAIFCSAAACCCSPASPQCRMQSCGHVEAIRRPQAAGLLILLHSRMPAAAPSRAVCVARLISAASSPSVPPALVTMLVDIRPM